jgi:alkylation response protein AidB-like acyl-CoA dehydrogenase
MLPAMTSLDDVQRMCADAALDFVTNRASIDAVRAILNRPVAGRFDAALWDEVAQLGWIGAALPEEAGGAGVGFKALGVIVETLGRHMFPLPLVVTAFAGAAVFGTGVGERNRYWGEQINSGALKLAFAGDEGAHHRPDQIGTALSGGTLTGKKTFVIGGGHADAFLVTAMDGEEPVIALVRADAAGVRKRVFATLDGQVAADLDLRDAAVEEVPVRGRDAVQRVLDTIRIGIAAEMTGGAKALFEMTTGYLKTREQFGQPIGAFQALKHRAALLAIEVELTTNLTLAALTALDHGLPVAALASAAKAKAGDCFERVAREAIQMHGGIGMTNQHPAGLYYKRSALLSAQLGNADFHRDRFATLNGY